jgi:hypothetical protein
MQEEPATYLQNFAKLDKFMKRERERERENIAYRPRKYS